ncbi:kinase-like protein, partial [Gymnopus androsaceus JB14]
MQVCDVANGLAYLHSMSIVHGDLKGVNVLITSVGRACVSDFGLSRIAESGGELWKMTSSISNVKGSTRWMAPELFRASPASYESDVYAFACVCYEIYTGLLPFHLVKSDAAVMLDIIQGTRPLHPDNITELNNGLWSIIESCWMADPSFRPTSKMLLQKLRDV